MFIQSGYGQLMVSPNADPQQLAQTIIGANVQVANAKLTAPNGSTGTFTAFTSNLGLSGGIILSTGEAIDAKGPNNEDGTTTSFGASGDTDLDGLAGGTTLDACVLEFDILPSSNTLKLQYVFGSEEYPEFVNSAFNDVFAIYVSGPGINGSMNIALIPGTNNPVSVNTVNNSTQSALYVDNKGGTSIAYDGFTKPLVAEVSVEPCKTYHVKIAIADVDDDQYDSGVFISGIKSETAPNTAYLNYTPNDTICSGTEMTFSLSGLQGFNYDWDLGDSTTATKSTTSHYYSTEGSYKVLVIASNGSKTCEVRDSVYVNVLALPNVNLGNDTIICNEQEFTIEANGSPDLNYLWSTTETQSQITVKQTNIYWVEADNDYCAANDSIQISFVTNPGWEEDTIACEGTSLEIQSNNFGVNYLWSTGESSEAITIASSGSYWVKVWAGNCIKYDTISADFLPPPNVNLGKDTVMCEGSSIDLVAPVGISYSYQWSTGDTSSSIVIEAPSTYSLSVFLANCVIEDTITVSDQNLANLGPDLTLCESPEIIIYGSLNKEGVSYLWSTGATIDSIMVDEPGIYWLEIVYGECNYVDSVEVAGHYLTNNIYIPNTFTPSNSDRLNDIFSPKGLDITSFQMQIFDRWGKVIFTSNDINTGWDGNYNGIQLQAGIYVYVIDFTTICNRGLNKHVVGRVMMQ